MHVDMDLAIILALLEYKVCPCWEIRKLLTGLTRASVINKGESDKHKVMLKITVDKYIAHFPFFNLNYYI